MRFRNDNSHYGVVAMALHWLVALLVLGMFALGQWMTSLTYYDPWYHRAPWWHEGIGVLLFTLVVIRLAWRLLNPQPEPLSSHRPWERRAAHAVHYALYTLLLCTPLVGYLIPTAEGEGLEVFGWFRVPVSLHGLPHQADIAGDVHSTLAALLITLVAVHALAALKHHFIDRDRTLLRMLGR